MTPHGHDMIRRRFSDAAARYAALADIQAAVARHLAEKLDVRGAVVLDVGAGDGAVAGNLLQAGGRVVALDAAWGMVEAGRRRFSGTAWVQADACALPFGDKCFDVVASASAYQWVYSLPCAFSEARRVLRPGGLFSAVMFAGGTLAEFFQSLEGAACKLDKPLPPMRHLPGVEDVRAAMRTAGFKSPKIVVEQRKTSFSSVTALLVWLKGIGANSLARRFYWGRGLLAMTEKEYRARFMHDDKLRASFELVWIEALA